jgi:hypothetical protein
VDMKGFKAVETEESIKGLFFSREIHADVYIYKADSSFPLAAWS